MGSLVNPPTDARAERELRDRVRAVVFAYESGVTQPGVEDATG